MTFYLEDYNISSCCSLKDTDVQQNIHNFSKSRISHDSLDSLPITRDHNFLCAYNDLHVGQQDDFGGEKITVSYKKGGVHF